MSEPEKRKLIVSLTSYPARISGVAQVLESLKRQTRPADEIVLYLSGDQYPGREKDLPEDLLKATEAGDALIRWVEGDLKPHKKYFYAFREYASDLVMTVDDDVIYPPEMIESFLETHRQYPGAVVAGRTHLMTFDGAGELNPYTLWVQRTMGFPEGPSLQLFAVGVGGVLYNPGMFPPELLNREAVRENCLEADDLWLKAMELAAGIPVVRTSLPELVKFVPGSQECSLYLTNQVGDRNEEYLANIRKWMLRSMGRDPFSGLSEDEKYPVVKETGDLLRYINNDRKVQLTGISKAWRRKEEQAAVLQRRAEALEENVTKLRESRSYRIGNAIIRPFARVLDPKGRNER